MDLDTTKTLAQLVNENPEFLMVFEKLRFRYDLAQDITIGEALALRNLQMSDLMDCLEDCEREARFMDPKDLQVYDIPQLLGYIVFVHHGYMERELPRLEENLHEAIRKDGPDHPELMELAPLFRNFREVLELHMKEEERHLFPFFLFLASPSQSHRFSLGGVVRLIEAFEDGDEEIESHLEQIRLKTRNYHVPLGAGKATQDLFHHLSRMEFELRRHMNVENNILFPKVTALEREQTQVGLKN